MSPVEVEATLPVYWLYWLCACESDENSAEQEREKRAESMRAKAREPWPH